MPAIPRLPLGTDGQPDFRGLHLMRHAVWVFDPSGSRMLHANGAALRLWRAPSLSEFLARDFSKASEAMRIRTDAILPRLGRGDVLRERNTFYPNGEPVAVDCLVSGLRHPDGHVVMLLEGGELQVSPHELRALEALRHMSAPVTLYDGEGEPLFRNPAALALYPGDGRRLATCLSDPGEAEELWHGMSAHADVDGRCRRVVAVNTAAGVRWHVLDARTTRDPADGSICVLVNEQDVTPEIEARARIEHLATHDPLTDLANRSLLRTNIETALAARTADLPVALLFLDLDGFKGINDTHGHGAGDELLCAVAARLRACAEERSSLVARLGGDEFAVLLAAPDVVAAASGLAADLISSLDEPFNLARQRCRVGVSIGVAVANARSTPDGLLHEADTALYRAKAAGRNTYRLFDGRSLFQGQLGCLPSPRSRASPQAAPLA